MKILFVHNQQLIFYSSWSNIHRYRNVHHRRTAEKMHVQEHYQDHRKVLYPRDHQFRKKFGYLFLDRSYLLCRYRTF